MTAALAVDLAVNGLVTGLSYALMAVGLSLIFGILRIVNFAHGEFYMVGAYAYTLAALRLGVPAWAALPSSRGPWISSQRWPANAAPT